MDARDTQTPNRRDQEEDRNTIIGEYEGTPSFYTTEETFEKYLGQTSHYLALQDAVVDLVASIDPDRILEISTWQDRLVQPILPKLRKDSIFILQRQHYLNKSDIRIT